MRGGQLFEGGAGASAAWRRGAAPGAPRRRLEGLVSLPGKWSWASMREAAEAEEPGPESDPRPGRPWRPGSRRRAEGGLRGRGLAAPGLRAFPGRRTRRARRALQPVPRGPPRISPLGFPEGRGDIPSSTFSPAAFLKTSGFHINLSV